ncbi:hypothetical protein PIB30_055566 [Stylosanthes scabra]|uniref:BHLH domain-containing protein n=1 Tax=Stylosanthes scabra TaxID=79078 RepID=A0ABU6YLJ5_9FABA|nr:hypothetical protein [Stylosanthes scabra]
MAKENQHIIFDDDDDEKKNMKKIIRREVERRRRTEMSTLCASLRSSLPFYLIKGKRSVCDHIGEAANYVQFLKQKIEALEFKRDRLLKQKQKQTVDDDDEMNIIPESSDHRRISDNSVSINLVPGGLEIDICVTNGCLSDLISILLQQGCHVVSCVSSQVNGTTFHSLLSQVEDSTTVDVTRLKKKLALAILLHANYSN